MIATKTAKVATRKTRCAIYTRKSSEEGLEQEFNSLDAQREAAEAYIASRKAEGWGCLPERYDDGGFTGGNMEPGRARMDFELDSISVDFGREVERRLNDALAEGHDVRVLFLPRSEALQDPELIRTKVSLIPEHVDPIRVIDIDGLDRQADGGTHVADTIEVGPVRVTKTESKGKGNKRMRIELAS